MQAACEPNTVCLLTKLAALAGFVDRNKRFPKSTWAFSSDAVGIIVGSAMGTSPVTAYIESSTGVPVAVAVSVQPDCTQSLVTDVQP